MPVIPTGLYPSLASIMSLFRNLVNDDMPGATATLGEGAIATNASAFTLNFLNAAIRDLYSDLRMVGAPSLIRDNYILKGLTPLNGPNGPGVPATETQVSITQTGYFDGYAINGDLTLPADMIEPEKLWERTSGTADEFRPMSEAAGGLYPLTQSDTFGEWEWRSDAIWLHGATVSRDLRIRYRAVFPEFLGPELDFANTFVPIHDSANAVVDKMAVRYSRRLAPERVAECAQFEKESTAKLKNEIVLRAQAIPNMRRPFGA